MVEQISRKDKTVIRFRIESRKSYFLEKNFFLIFKISFQIFLKFQMFMAPSSILNTNQQWKEMFFFVHTPHIYPNIKFSSNFSKFFIFLFKFGKILIFRHKKKRYKSINFFLNKSPEKRIFLCLLCQLLKT